MSDVKIIGFTGPKGSGKDAAADVLVRELGWVKINPGDPIRAMVRALLEHVGVAEDEARDIVTDPVLRERKLEFIPGAPTARFLMQTLGDDWGRSLIREDLYAGLMVSAARELLEAGVPGVAITGVRKPNEAIWIKQLGGEIWRVERPRFGATGEHSSERGFEAIEADLTINNDGDLWSLNHGLVPLFFRRNLAGVTDEMRARIEAARLAQSGAASLRGGPDGGLRPVAETGRLGVLTDDVEQAKKLLTAMGVKMIAVRDGRLGAERVILIDAQDPDCFERLWGYELSRSFVLEFHGPISNRLKAKLAERVGRYQKRHRVGAGGPDLADAVGYMAAGLSRGGLPDGAHAPEGRVKDYAPNNHWVDYQSAPESPAAEPGAPQARPGAAPDGAPDAPDGAEDH